MLKKNNIIFILILVLALLTGVSFINLSNAVYADSLDKSLFLPKDALAVKELSSPLSSYYDEKDGPFMLITEYNSPKLTVYIDGKYVTYTGDGYFTNAKNFNKDYIVVSCNGCRKIKKSNSNRTNPLENFSYSSNIEGNFDTNGKYLVTASTGLTIYTIYGDDFSKKEMISGVDVDNHTPVCINDNNDVFYIFNNKVCKYSIDEKQQYENLTEDNVSGLTSLTANGNYVYYILNYDVYRVSTFGGKCEKLSVKDDYVDGSGNYIFDLGHLYKPNNLSFKGKNLLITDTLLNAVQEFEIIGSDMVFTGFAVANGKTAFNRFSMSNYDVESYIEDVAVLDDYKFTYIKDGKYHNVLSSKLGINPKTFALGNNCALFSNSVNSCVFVKDLDGEKIQSEKLDLNVTIKDVYFQSDKFYLLTNDGARYQVYLYNEENNQIEKLFDYAGEGTKLAVDGFKNVYVYKNGTIYVHKFGDYNRAKEVKNNLNNVKEMKCDFNGNIFYLQDNKINQVQISDKTVQSFAINVYEKSLLFIENGSEYIYSTNKINNVCIKDLSLSNVKTTSSSAEGIENLKIVYGKENADFYQVNVDFNNDKITYKNLAKTKIDGKEMEYDVVGEISNGDQTYCLLYGEDQRGNSVFVIANKNSLTEKEEVYSLTSTKRYALTGVCLYYLPNLTKDGEFAVISNGKAVKLERSTEIQVKATLSFINKDYYYVKYKVDGNDIYGYLPCNFTTEKLTFAPENVDFSIENAHETQVFDIEGNVISNLSEGEEIRVLSIEEDLAKILLKNGDEYLYGYININSIISAPQNTVRTILIVILLGLAVSVSSIYLVIKKVKE